MSIKNYVNKAVASIRDAMDNAGTTDIQNCLDAAIQNLEDALIYDLQIEDDEGDKTYEQQHKQLHRELI